MALHDRGVATTLSNLPLSPGQWLTSGLIMPAVQFEVEDEGLQRSNTTLQVRPVGGGAHILGSAAIYSELNRRYPLGSSSGSGGSSTGSSSTGSSSTSTAQGSRADYSALLAAQEELESLFFCYCQGRTRDAVAFVRAFALFYESARPWTNSLLRPLLCLYFFGLITLGRTLEWLRGRPLMDMDLLARKLMGWEQRLGDHDFFSGDGTAPRTLGCMASCSAWPRA